MQENNNKGPFLSTQGYRGTRDFYPEDQRFRNYLYQHVHSILKSFGYEEYAGPFVEPLELYAAKSSEEIVREQLYSFVDKGDRTLAIRPEMTPTLARMVAAKQQEMPKPIRWYSIPTCMRFERPQRGRLREFDQLNVDIFGGNPLDEDIETLLTIVRIFQSFGASLEDFVIRVNHRALVNAFLRHQLGQTEDSLPPLLRLLDKRDKLSTADFQTQCQSLGLDQPHIDKLEAFLGATTDNLAQVLEGCNQDPQIAHTLAVIQTVNQVAGGPCVRFDATVMRGFDYYTGLVFEVFDTHPENRRALCGGGRYDNLINAFGPQSLSGIGYGMGDVALANFVDVHGLRPTLGKQTDMAVLRFDHADITHPLLLAKGLRACGLAVESCVVVTKFGKQLQNAQKSGVLAVAFCGDDERAKGLFAVKWLQTGEQEVFGFHESGFQQCADKVRQLKHVTS